MKDRQKEVFCADVASVCDTAYRFYIGRGAYNFTAEDWTHLEPTVVFTLFVDGQPMYHRTDNRHITQ